MFKGIIIILRCFTLLLPVAANICIDQSIKHGSPKIVGWAAFDGQQPSTSCPQSNSHRGKGIRIQPPTELFGDESGASVKTGSIRYIRKGKKDKQAAVQHMQRNRYYYYCCCISTIQCGAALCNGIAIVNSTFHRAVICKVTLPSSF
jgi:hypothetical protein